MRFRGRLLAYVVGWLFAVSKGTTNVRYATPSRSRAPLNGLAVSRKSLPNKSLPRARFHATADLTIEGDRPNKITSGPCREHVSMLRPTRTRFAALARKHAREDRNVGIRFAALARKIRTRGPKRRNKVCSPCAQYAREGRNVGI